MGFILHFDNEEFIEGHNEKFTMMRTSFDKSRALVFDERSDAEYVAERLGCDVMEK